MTPAANAVAPGRSLALAVIVGLVVGALSLGIQATLPGSLNHLGNSGAIWLLPAFFIGSRSATARLAAVAGVVTLLAELLGYFLTAGLFVGFPYWPILVYWAAHAFVGGPIFATAGRWWRGPVSWQRRVGLGLLGAVFVAEGVFYLSNNTHDQAFGIGMVVAGALWPLLLGRTGRDRLLAYLALLPLAALGVAAYFVASSLFPTG